MHMTVLQELQDFVWLASSTRQQEGTSTSSSGTSDPSFLEACYEGAKGTLIVRRDNMLIKTYQMYYLTKSQPIKTEIKYTYEQVMAQFTLPVQGL
jgi:hypothetical protein